LFFKYIHIKLIINSTKFIYMNNIESSENRL